MHKLSSVRAAANAVYYLFTQGVTCHEVEFSEMDLERDGLDRQGVWVCAALDAFAAPAWARPDPEMDPGLAMSAMSLLSGGLLIIAGRSRRK